MKKIVAIALSVILFSAPAFSSTLNVEGDFDRLMVKKDGVQYYYTQEENLTIPLQLGGGKYEIYLLNLIEGKRYSVVEKREYVLDKTEEKFLGSAQPVTWGRESKFIQYVDSLENKSLENVAQEVLNSLNYDYQKMHIINADYVPNIDQVYTSKKGICYDYSALFASAMRSLGVPTKLVKGYRVGVQGYHAWNEVYIDGEWKTIDLTYNDTSSNKKLIQDSKLYTTIRFY